MKSEAPKFAAVLIALALLLVGIVAFSALQRPQRDGELAFDVESVDVGNVPLGKQIVQRWTMKNVGDKPVTITGKNVAALEGC